MHGHKESNKDLMNTSLMLYQLSYQGSDESSLGFLRYTNF